MALPPSWQVQNMQRSLAAGRGERRLSEQDSAQVLSWLHEALTQLEHQPHAG